LDRPPLPPTPIQPHDAPPPVRAAIDAFVAGLDPHDPILVAFNAALVPMVVSDPTLPDNPLIYVNAAFERLTGFAAVEVIGRNCRFMQGPLTEAADVARLRDAIARRERIEIDLLNHHRDGTPFWNRLIVAPVFDAGGALRYFIASQLDVTIERHRLIQLQEDRAMLAAEVAAREVALAEREARLKLALRAGGLGTWTMDPVTYELTASPSCKANFDYAPDEPLAFADIAALVHPADLPALEAVTAATISTGQPLDIEYRILTRAGEQRWIAIQAEMQYRADGSPLLLSGFSTNISTRKFAEEHRTILARELTHRVKNTLATVGAVVSQTLRDATSLADARVAVAGRIASLGAAHELLVRDEVEGAAIGDIVDRVLAPFVDRGGMRFVIGGPAIRLTPEVTLALSMALHELATNAVKYGALANDTGTVRVEWGLGGSTGDRHLHFTWAERGGPPVVPPTRTGFGSRMIERVLGQHVRGEAALSFPPEGVRFAIEIPV
jgi:PAS domain S-box-containing protein